MARPVFSKRLVRIVASQRTVDPVDAEQGIQRYYNIVDALTGERLNELEEPDVETAHASIVLRGWREVQS